MARRNPRWNPAVGDRLLKGKFKGVLERRVLAVYEGRVDFKARGKRYSTTLDRWREWSADARITHTG